MGQKKNKKKLFLLKLIFFIIKEIIQPTTKSKLIRMSGPPTFPVANTFAEVDLSQYTLLKAGIYTSPIDVEHHILPTFHRLGHNIVIYDNSTGCFHVVSAKIESSDYLFGVVEKDSQSETRVTVSDTNRNS